MQRPNSKNTRQANADEKRFHQAIKESNYCAACEKDRPVFVHHCKGSTYRHLKTLIGHWFCIGLCQECDDIITQGSRRKFKQMFGPQSLLWLKIIGLAKNVPSDVYDAIIDCGE